MNGDDGVLELTVGEFSRRFAEMVAKHSKLKRIAIVGEITGIKHLNGGHLTMTLKEGEAVLSCFSFASEVRRFPPLKEGVSVRAQGSIEVRPDRSQYQLRALTVSLVGEGKLAAEIEELRMRLRAEGAFDASRKRPIPDFPRRVALITSNDDARADFEGRLRADAPHVDVRFFQTRVQGRGAEIDVAEAMDRAARVKVDVVVITRGGGSSEDRLTFNLEPVVRAILRSPHPVITALGHMKNRHLADEVADLAVATPTAAAVHLSREWLRAFQQMRTRRADLLRGYRSLVATKIQSVTRSDERLVRAARDFVRRAAERVRELDRDVDRRNPATRLAQWRLRLVKSAGALDRGAERILDQSRRHVELAHAALDAEDPTRPLARGFAIVTKAGVAVHDAATLAPGDAVSARLQRGTFAARVESVSAE